MRKKVLIILTFLFILLGIYFLVPDKEERHLGINAFEGRVLEARRRFIENERCLWIETPLNTLF